jgi:Mg-chelatase subunit ChlI
MTSEEDLLKMSITEVAQAIVENNKETHAFYEALASKIRKRTNGERPMGDDKVPNAEYWLKIAKEQRKMLAMDFDLDGFEESVIGFKLMSELAASNGSISVKLKTARETTSKDCYFFCAVVRRAAQSKEKDPVFALILEKEPNPRKTPVAKSETTTADSNAKSA